MNNKHHEITRLAYEIYEKRGCSPGYELDDWLEAESLILILPISVVEPEPETTMAVPKSRGKKSAPQTAKEKKPRKTTAKTTKKAPVKK